MGINDVLIIDDETAIAGFLEIRLNHKRKNLCIEKISDGQKAVDIVKKKKPRLVFVDLMMPQIDSYELITKLKSYNKSACIYALSVCMTDDKRERALKAGADDAYNKDGFVFLDDVLKKAYKK